MKEPGVAVTASKKGEGIVGKEEREEGGGVKGREMQAVLGEEGGVGGKERIEDGGERRAVTRAWRASPRGGRNQKISARKLSRNAT